VGSNLMIVDCSIQLKGQVEKLAKVKKKKKNLGKQNKTPSPQLYQNDFS